MEMDSYDFLQLFKGILSKTPKARRDVDNIIDECYEEETQYKRDLEQYEQDLIEYEEYEKNKGNQDSNDYEEDEFADPDENQEDEVLTNIHKSNQVDEDDYSTWSQRDLQRAQDDALDDGDYALAAKISPFIK